MMKNWIEKLRGRVADASPKLSAAAYLPDGLIWFTLFVIFTDLCFILFSQPLLYWVYKGRAESGFPLLKSILDAGVWVYILAGLGYLLIIWFLLTVLTRSASLVLWFPVTFVHISHSIRWVVWHFLSGNPTSLPEYLVTYTNAVAALICGFLLVRILLRPAREAPSKKFVRFIKPGCSVVWVCGLIGILIFQAISHHSGWQPVTPEHTPGKRSYSNIVYDSHRQVFVMFGGLSNHLGGSFEYANDTWEWDGEDWKEIHTVNSPSPRANYSMAYDEKREQVVLFGGNNKDEITVLQDTWVYDGHDWTMKKSSYSPQARRDAQMFYDPDNGNIILSGGSYRSKPDEDFKKYQDIWEWDGERWSSARASKQRITINRQTTTWDEFNKRLLVFDYDRILEWENGQWTPLNIDPFPVIRWGSQIAANPKDGKILLFGGGKFNVERNDTWVLEGSAWRDLQPSMKPTQRDGFLLFFDPKRQSFILYGGWDNRWPEDLMWEYVIPK